MATRNQRKARAKAKATAKLEALATAQRAANVAATVHKNMSQRPERNYYASIKSSSALVHDTCGGATGRHETLFNPRNSRADKPRFVGR